MEESIDLTRERDARCVPVAKAILRLIAENEGGELGSVPAEGLEAKRASWFATTEKALSVLLQANVTLSEVNYVQQLVLEAQNNVMTVCAESINDSVRRMQQKLLGGKHLEDVSLAQVDTILRGTP